MADMELVQFDALLDDLSSNITPEDLNQLKLACKEDIPSNRSQELTGCKEWFNFLEKHNKLSKDNLSYIEHVFELSRRPDLLTMVLEYRTKVLKVSEEQESDSKFTRIPSAVKYRDVIRQPSEDEIIKLQLPPKKV